MNLFPLRIGGKRPDKSRLPTDLCLPILNLTDVSRSLSTLFRAVHCVWKARLWNWGNVDKDSNVECVVPPAVDQSGTAFFPSFVVEKFSNPQMFVKNFRHLGVLSVDVGSLWEPGGAMAPRLSSRNDFAFHCGGEPALHTFHRFVEESGRLGGRELRCGPRRVTLSFGL